MVIRNPNGFGKNRKEKTNIYLNWIKTTFAHSFRTEIISLAIHSNFGMVVKMTH